MMAQAGGEDTVKAAWTDATLTNPHALGDKAGHVGIFGAIARSYDLNNRLHSGWQDQAWRRFAVKRRRKSSPGDRVLDVACGTGRPRPGIRRHRGGRDRRPGLHARNAGRVAEEKRTSLPEPSRARSGMSKAMRSISV